MKVTFFPHSITYDNEANLASGWNDVKLSPEGKKRIVPDWANKLKLDSLDAVFASDLERAYNTAKIAFPDITTDKLFIDWRLRECDYGEMTSQPKDVVDPVRANYIHKPFPGGESYEQAMLRMKSFIDDLKHMPYQNVIVIGSRATHYGFDIYVDGKTIERCLSHKFVWQPGWIYEV